MKQTLFCAALLLAVSLFPSAAAGQDLIRLARPDANMMVGIRVADFASSPLVQTMWREAAASKPDFQQLLGMMGPNPLELLDEVLITASVTGASETGPKDALFLASGRFEQTQLLETLCRNGCETEMYRGSQIRKALGKSDEPSHFAMLDSGLVAMGSLEQVQGAIERRETGALPAFSEGMSDWINRLSRYHIWVAAAGPFPQAPVSGDNAAEQMISNFGSKLNGFGLGVEVANDVAMSLELRTATEKDAQQFYDLAQGFIAMAKANKQKPEAKEFLEKLQLSHEGTILGAQLRVSGAEIRKQLAEQRAKGGREGRQAGAFEGQPQRPTPPPRPKRRSGGIRIYGLGDDAVEVPTTRPQ